MNYYIRMSIIDIIKLIGSIAAIIGTCYAIANSKRFLINRINYKKKQIERIDHQLMLRYGKQYLNHPYSALDRKKERLSQQIIELTRYL